MNTISQYILWSREMYDLYATICLQLSIGINFSKTFRLMTTRRFSTMKISPVEKTKRVQAPLEGERILLKTGFEPVTPGS